jgi:pimeloyl-ACP methyl ester carboxylesterase
MPEVELRAGTIEYQDTGAGAVVVLVHGLLMDGAQWRDVVADLRSDYRCILPTLPLGAHRRPMRHDAELSLHGMGRILADFLEALNLHNVTLCFNDWSGAQVMIADGLMGRVARLVLVSCEAFDNYPPGIPGWLAARSAEMPGGLICRGFRADARTRTGDPFITSFEPLSPPVTRSHLMSPSTSDLPDRR